MTEETFAGSPDLWISSLPTDRGPEANVKLWKDAEIVLEDLCTMFERGLGDNDLEGVTGALVDAYNRCIEERRRAEDLCELRKAWSNRTIGGVNEPPSPVRRPT